MSKPAQNDRPKTIPPYLPYKTFQNTIAGWRVALPGRIDRSVLGSYSGAMQTWMMSALRYFGLITGDGIPTERLRQLTKGSDAERKPYMAEMVRLSYPFLFAAGFDLTKATPAMLYDKFKETGAQGETLAKCLSFFLAIAKDAGYELSPFLRMRQRRNGATRRPTRRMPTIRSSRGNVLPGAHVPPVTKSALETLIDLLDPNEMDEKEEQAVWTLIRYLKKRESES